MKYHVGFLEIVMVVVEAEADSAWEALAAAEDVKDQSYNPHYLDRIKKPNGALSMEYVEYSCSAIVWEADDVYGQTDEWFDCAGEVEREEETGRVILSIPVPSSWKYE